MRPDRLASPLWSSSCIGRPRAAPRKFLKFYAQIWYAYAANAICPFDIVGRVGAGSSKIICGWAKAFNGPTQNCRHDDAMFDFCVNMFTLMLFNIMSN